MTKQYLTKSKIFKALDLWADAPPEDRAGRGRIRWLKEEVFGTLSSRQIQRVKQLLPEWHDAREARKASEEPELPLSGGVMEDPAERRTVDTRTGPRRYVFTCAQNNTDLIPEDWWRTLMKLVDFYDAELHVSRFTYNKAAYGKNSVKPGSTKSADTADLFYPDEILPYVSDEDLQIAPDLVWLGSACLLPTLVNPISGWQNHTREASCILPHTKIAMESVATMKHAPTKFVYTTGAVTQRNYIQKGAGQKADFHHVFGALLVEVDEDGDWWARQLNFDKNGGLYDLDKFFTPDEVFEDVRTEAVTHGDTHGHKRNRAVVDSVFRPVTGLLDVLMPRYQFFEDIVDFMPRNRHNRHLFMFIHDMYKSGFEKVEDEFTNVAEFLMNTAYRAWCKSHVVVSNHDQAIIEWLDDRRVLDDPPNLKLWLRMNLDRAMFPSTSQRSHPFRNLLLDSCSMYVNDHKEPPRVILEDESFKLCGVEMGMHGHLGPNGARGTPRNLRTVGKATTGHTHSAGIVEGVYTAGVLGDLDMGYNKGPSSWSHSSVVMYANGKRTIVTYRKGKWFL